MYVCMYGVVDDKLYRRAPPTHSQDNWQGSATLVGTNGWSVFKFLFFSPDGLLWAVHGSSSTLPGYFVKGTPPTDENDNWSRRAGYAGLAYFHRCQELFFMADGYMYMVLSDALWKHPPDVNSGTPYAYQWSKICTSNWSDFKFLMAPLPPA